ncbi:drug/metabolite transporter (DMT)-like permease [Melghirimyces profundicolus]|uniref:Drug/metabolite transporter (DMT)-like permease n=1 Tax=Melghirimyces profundicolus TaxID=1242148 RepID=A0A2T6B825_9BACL|nr:DMT family transporter [Melghirimyces profundicolus]PTX52204.1 drug/metabolite transporter (DMT)-like permease [Melghirimyces profundicolus]
MTGRNGTYGLLTLMAVFWGSAFVGSKVAVGSVPPEVAAFFRFGLGGVFMWLILRTRKKENRLIPSAYRGIVLFLGVTGVAAYNWLFFRALDFSMASDGSMIIPTMSPVFTTLLAVLFLKEVLTRRQVFGLCLSCLGSLVFFSGIMAGGFDGTRMTGDLLFLLAAGCWSVYTLYGNRVLKELDPFPVTAYAMLTGAVVLGAVALPRFGTVQWGELGFDFWALQLYLALFPSVLANWFYYRGVKRIGASRAAVFMYLVPVSGVFLAILLLEERLTGMQLTGSLLMILGVWFVNRKRIPSAPSTEQPVSRTVTGGGRS